MHSSGVTRLDIIAPIFLALALGLASPSHAATPFVHETVDAWGDVGQYTSLALDAQGNPHISYLDVSNGDLKYASGRGGTWTIETVDATGLVGYWSSLALDAQDNPRISYLDLTNSDLKYASKSGGAWTIETVDATGIVGDCSSLALDAQGNPRISYYDDTNGDLKYASRSVGTWTIETVDATGRVGEYTSLALDAQGNPRISYYDVTNHALKYAGKSGSTWAIETVEADEPAYYTSLALDAEGIPRISYTYGFLKYASKSGGTWALETVDGASTDFNSSLAIDAQGNPRISYYSQANGDLRYASKSGSTWTIESVDIAGAVGQYTSLALDAQGNPCISYYNATSGDLKFTDSAVHVVSPAGGEYWAAGSRQTVSWRGAGTVGIYLSSDGGLTYSTLLSSIIANTVVVTVPDVTTEAARVMVTRSSPVCTSQSPGYFSIAPGLVSPWWTETVDALGSVGQYASLVFDAKGNPHMSYLDATNLDLKYASRYGGTWTIETVDAAGNVGGFTSLRLDAQGNPRIGYYDYSNLDLKYASKLGGVWTIETVDATGDVGQYTSLALDAQGNPRISYYDATNFDLKYSSKSGGIWTTETVGATGGAVGHATSLALDAQGNPRISYYDAINSDLKYASKAGGTWTIEVVDATGIEGYYSSLALDAQGNPRIGYYDYSNYDLKYASKSGGVWTIETVDATGDVGQYTSLALDAQGNPRISYYDATNEDLKYSSKSGGTWTTETVDAAEAVGALTSLALDAQGNPRIGYVDTNLWDLKCASAAVELVEPAAGASWTVGATGRVMWQGTGLVDLYLSTDGGSTWSLQASGLNGGEFGLVVPDAATEHARVKLERAVPQAFSETPGFFRIVEPAIAPAVAHRLQLAPAGAAAGDDLGWSVAGARDVNGDGYADFIVGAPYNDVGGTNAGRAYIYYGGPGADAVPDVVLTGAAATDQFGISVAGAGDVNGDGYADVIVGAHQNDAGGTDAGRAYVYFGGPSMDATADVTLTGAAASDYFGGAVAGAGDANGDGYADVIVGARTNDGGGTDAGRAYVYLGGPSMDATADVVLTGAAASDYFGVAVAGAGDVNGDGYADVIAGARANDGGGTDAGRAYVYYGGSSMDAVADVILTGEAAGDNFGGAVAGAGDVSGDGYADVIVGARLNDAGGTDAGRAYVFLGGPSMDATADVILTGAAAGDEFSAFAVAGIGDVNRDSYADVVIGAWHNDAAGANAGRAYVFFGGPVMDASAAIVLTGAAAGDCYGNSVAGTGDVNGDGFPDLIVGAETNDAGGTDAGRAYLYDFNRHFVIAPNGGETWSVGATKSVSWSGAERADVWLSTDGGATYERLLAGAGGLEANSAPIRVPHTPTRFARIKVTPASSALAGVDQSDSLFTIQTSVSLLAFIVAPAPDGGAELNWSTDPVVGPEGIAGYRLYRLTPGSAGAGARIGPELITETRYADHDGTPGATYRLAAVNGFGEELELAQAALAQARPLAAWPLPYRSGALTVSFGVAGGIAGAPGRADVVLFDLVGRKVRTLASGHYDAGYHNVTWDGRDAAGHPVSGGIYFIRSQTGGETHRIKVVVMP
jgi:hypothetical protein